jgi:hypothetical protein
MTDEQKKLLERHASHFADMASYVRECDPAELDELEAACRATSTTNCWWATYDAAKYLLWQIASERGVRERNAKEATQTATPQ